MNKKILIASSIVVLVAAAGGGYWYAKKAKHHSGKISDSSDAFSDLKKAHGLTVSTHLSSPTGKAWKEKNFTMLSGLFGISKAVKENRNFFQASIYVLDVAKPDWKPEDKEHVAQLQEQIADYMTAKREKPVIGDEAQVLSYASKVLLKFDSLSEKTVHHLLNFYKAAPAGNQKDIVAETLVRLNPLPEKARKIVQDKIHSKTEPYEAVLTISQMRDLQAASEFWNEIYRSYGSYNEKIKPLIFKQLVINRGMVKGDLKKYLGGLAKKSGESDEEAFLVGVRELSSLEEFRSEVIRISNESQFPQNKGMAKAILSSTAGAVENSGVVR